MTNIVSIASWPPRIKYVEACVRSLLAQTVKPDSIELNLSAIEFPGRESELPEPVRRMAEDGSISINWEEDNTYCFRKEIPVVKRHMGEDYNLFSVDDDCLYAPTYIETMLENLSDYDAYNPEPGVVGNRGVVRGRVFSPDFWERLNKDVVDAGISDTWLAVYLDKVKARCRWGFRKESIDPLVSENDGAASKSANSERIGGYTPQRQILAWKLSTEALK